MSLSLSQSKSKSKPKTVSKDELITFIRDKIDEKIKDGEDNIDILDYLKSRFSNIITEDEIDKIFIEELIYDKPEQFDDDVFKKYDLIKFLGSGSFANVFLGLYEGKKYAIKQINMTRGNELVKLFNKELEILKILYEDGKCIENNILCLNYGVYKKGSKYAYIISDYIENAVDFITLLINNEKFKENILNHQLWLCPVTEYVFEGGYPEKIYIKLINNK